LISPKIAIETFVKKKVVILRKSKKLNAVASIVPVS